MKKNILMLSLCISAAIIAYASTASSTPVTERSPAGIGTYPVVGTNQDGFWDSDGKSIATPAAGTAFYGQDAQHPSKKSSYRNNGDGTISDMVTGLMWTQTTDRNGDAAINKADKLTYADAIKSASKVTLGGYNDWRLPTIKELYSLIRFNGQEPRPQDRSAAGLTPFIDSSIFGFGYGEVSAGERIIDSNYASSTLYKAKTTILIGPAVRETETMFGLNFADGRIKGYPTHHVFYVLYVRGNTSYGLNNYQNNGDGTVTDAATGIMWTQSDSAVGMDWGKALAWVQKKNAEKYLGHADWRLPDIKELQSIVDYSRSPESTKSAAIDSVFKCTSIKNEADQNDWPCYWSSTTHLGKDGVKACYIAFGRAMGKKGGSWGDVHGAGAQRSDPKIGNANDFPNGRGPQGDAIRINNFVRLVSDVK